MAASPWPFQIAFLTSSYHSQRKWPRGAFSISAWGRFEEHPIQWDPGCSEPDCPCLRAPGGVTEPKRALEKDRVFQSLIQASLWTLQRQRIHHLPRQRCLCSPAPAALPTTSLWASSLQSGFSIWPHGLWDWPKKEVPGRSMYTTKSC